MDWVTGALGGGAVGSVGSGAGSVLEKIFGRKPKVAQWKNISLTDEQKKALKGNLENFPEIQQLGDAYRQYFTSQNEALLPGYAAALASGEKGVQGILDRGNQFLTGEIPKDVQEQLQRNSAYQAFSGGYGGSGMSKALTARDLGLTSLDMISRGADMIGRGGNSAQQWAGIASRNIMSPDASLISPMQGANFDMQNAMLQNQTKQFGFNVDAAPDPVYKGITDTVVGLIGAYLGAGRGGGGGITQPAPSTTPWNAGWQTNTYPAPSGGYGGNWYNSASGY